MTYLYHGTTMENLPSIAQCGLIPRQRGGSASYPAGRFRRLGLFVSLTEDDAFGWAMDRGMSIYSMTKKSEGETVLRFKAEGKELIPDTRPRGPKGRSFILFDTIPPEELEIRSGQPYEHGPWEPLRRYMKSG
jgi:hypothetical protein